MIAVASFAGLGLALVVLLWPRPEWKDTASPSRVIESAVEGTDPLPLNLIRRDIALHIESVYRENERLYERLAGYFRLAAILLDIEVLAWIGDLLSKA